MDKIFLIPQPMPLRLPQRWLCKKKAEAVGDLAGYNIAEKK